MRVLVCGGRNFLNRVAVYTELDRLKPSVVIHGAALGADGLAADWCATNNVPTEPYYPEWGKWGKAAGPIRNQRMIDEGKPDLVLAFSGGRGTADMVYRADKAGIPVRSIEPKTTTSNGP